MKAYEMNWIKERKSKTKGNINRTFQIRNKIFAWIQRLPEMEFEIWNRNP